MPSIGKHRDMFQNGAVNIQQSDRKVLGKIWSKYDGFLCFDYFITETCPKFSIKEERTKVLVTYIILYIKQDTSYPNELTWSPR